MALPWQSPQAVPVSVLQLLSVNEASSLRAMLQAARTLAARSGRFMLCAPSANLRSLLKVTGFDQLLETFDTRTAALSALQRDVDTDA